MLQQVLAIYPQVCAQCGDGMQILGVVESPDAIRAILTALGLPSRAASGSSRAESDDLAPDQRQLELRSVSDSLDG